MANIKNVNMQGQILLSVLLKADNPSWGANNEISDEVNVFFSQCDISGIRSFLNAASLVNIDEETLFLLSTIYDRPELSESVFNLISEHKNIDTDIYKFCEELFNKFEELKNLNPPFLKTISAFVDTDLEKREQMGDQVSDQIDSVNNYFRIVNPSQLTIVATNPLMDPNTGRAITLPGEVIVISSIDNLYNLEHEYLHSIVNPITSNLLAQMPDTFQEQIINAANPSLRESYGDHAHSLLAEEMIRTYQKYVEPGRSYPREKEFVTGVQGLSVEQFVETISNPLIVARLSALGILNLEDLKNNAGLYYNIYEVQGLGPMIYQTYQEYNQISPNSDIAFEYFVRETLPLKLPLLSNQDVQRM